VSHRGESRSNPIGQSFREDDVRQAQTLICRVCACPGDRNTLSAHHLKTSKTVDVEGEHAPATPHLTPRRSLEELADDDGAPGIEARFLLKLKGLAGKLADADRAFLLDFAGKLATR
jgi:hypothetical protein